MRRLGEPMESTAQFPQSAGSVIVERHEREKLIAEQTRALSDAGYAAYPKSEKEHAQLKAEGARMKTIENGVNLKDPWAITADFEGPVPPLSPQLTCEQLLDQGVKLSSVSSGSIARRQPEQEATEQRRLRKGWGTEPSEAVDNDQGSTSPAEATDWSRRSLSSAASREDVQRSGLDWRPSDRSAFGPGAALQNQEDQEPPMDTTGLWRSNPPSTPSSLSSVRMSAQRRDFTLSEIRSQIHSLGSSHSRDTGPSAAKNSSPGRAAEQSGYMSRSRSPCNALRPAMSRSPSISEPEWAIRYWSYEEEMRQLKDDLREAARHRPKDMELFRTFDLQAFADKLGVFCPPAQHPICPTKTDASASEAPDADVPEASDAPADTPPDCLPPHRAIIGAAELGSYLSASSYIVSLGGPPLPDLKYGIIIVPAGEEGLLFDGHGEQAVMPAEIQAQVRLKSRGVRKELEIEEGKVADLQKEEHSEWGQETEGLLLDDDDLRFLWRWYLERTNQDVATPVPSNTRDTLFAEKEPEEGQSNSMDQMAPPLDTRYSEHQSISSFCKNRPRPPAPRETSEPQGRQITSVSKLPPHAPTPSDPETARRAVDAAYTPPLSPGARLAFEEIIGRLALLSLRG